MGGGDVGGGTDVNISSYRWRFSDSSFLCLLVYGFRFRLRKIIKKMTLRRFLDPPLINIGHSKLFIIHLI